jgi:hypothetical protein
VIAAELMLGDAVDLPAGGDTLDIDPGSGMTLTQGCPERDRRPA